MHSGFAGLQDFERFGYLGDLYGEERCGQRHTEETYGFWERKEHCGEEHYGGNALC